MISVKDSQGKIHVDNGNFFGFKARDLFNNFGYGLTFGYQPKFSILGGSSMVVTSLDNLECNLTVR